LIYMAISTLRYIDPAANRREEDALTTLEATSAQLKAFADPTRLRILNLLHEGELCVCHLVEILDQAQPSISRHLALLRGAGLVCVRKEGNWRHYALPELEAGLVASLLACVSSCLRPIDDLQQDLERLRLISTGCAPKGMTP
jgi:ArsR family transcriptional regulator